MTVLTIRSKVKPESAAEVEAAAREMLAAIAEAQPQGVRYPSCRLPDAYVAPLEVEDGTDNTLGARAGWISAGAARTSGKEIIMDARFNYYGNTVSAKFAEYINSAGTVVADSALPTATQGLVKIRASQINGCAYCTDMHTKDAEHAGESSVRLNLVAVWREAKVFTEAERAALELTEQGTRIAYAAGGVTDDAWADAAKHYDDDQLAALVSLIAEINAWNRLNVITRQPAGDYQPGKFG